MDIIYTDKRLCTCCMEEHDVKTVRVKEMTEFKGTRVDYLAEYLYCDNAEEYYMNESMMSTNDIRVKDAYRKKVGLLTSEDICSIRAEYDISQSDLCTLLGWGGKTIARYETHQVQDKAHDSILKKLSQDPEWFLYLLTEAKGDIPSTTYEKYFKTATELFKKNEDYYLRKAIEAKYADICNNKMYTGNAELSLDKVKDVICYFANSSKVTNLFKVKLMKLLWYADFLSYKIRGFAITGLVYRALPMGAVPIGHDTIIDLSGINYEEIDIGEETAYHFISSNQKEYRHLSKDDITILNQVIDKLGRMSKDDIVSFMHKEQAFTATAQRNIIKYHYAESLQI